MRYGGPSPRTSTRRIGESGRRCRRRGACNPPLAHRALEADADIGLLLPCNVVVQESERAGETVIEAIDPVVQMGVAGQEGLAAVAEDVRCRLERVLDRATQGE